MDPEKGLVILKGDGKGRFTHMQDLPVGDHNHGVIAEDVNRDGHLGRCDHNGFEVVPQIRDQRCAHTFW